MEMNLKTMVFLLATACVLVSPGSGWATTWVYDGNVDPTSANSAGTGLQFVAFNVGGTVPATSVATVAAYPYEMRHSVDGYAWLMNDGPSGKKQYRSDPLCTIQDNPGTPGATLVVRMNSVFAFGASGSGTSWGGSIEDNLGIRENDGMSTGWHWSGAGDTIHGISNPPGWVRETDGRSPALQSFFTGRTMDWYKDFHNMRVLVNRESSGDRHIRVYFDETLILEIPNASKVQETVIMDSFYFGTGSTSGQQSIFYDGLVATNDGAYLPGTTPTNPAFEALVTAHAPPFPEPGTVLLLMAGSLFVRVRRRQ